MMCMDTRLAIAIFLGSSLAAGAMSAMADTISVDGVRHEGVLVEQTARMIYVRFPANGEILSYPREGVPDDAVAESSADERRKLEAAWDALRSTSQSETVVPDVAPTRAVSPAYKPEDETRSRPSVKRFTLKGDPAVAAEARRRASEVARSDGMVDHVKLDDVPLADALDALLRPLGLDYTLANGYLYITSPNELTREAQHEIESRVYQLKSVGAESLPKIVVRPQQQLLGGGTGSGGFGNSGGGGGSFGGSGNARGGQSGFGGAQNGARGGGGGGFGGGGGGRGGNGSDVTAISNISDLFTTIDDRQVGEAPALIGP